ncbi:MAG: hypothetical protein H5T70_14185, partial [Chloroflexi bacterium]|nr:hypothetical protein [Chloroflexota bacterium]
RWEQGLRDFSQSLATVMTPYLLLGALFLAAVWLGQRLNAQRRLARERRLSGLYARLREQIRLERWADAREIIEQIRAEAPRYRDIERIDAVVSAAEGAGWRREQLYNTGLQAYKARNWPDAVHAFQAVEQEAPYYREVRFLRRTAALYADLQSRDRSLRLKAAQELGAVA